MFWVELKFGPKNFAIGVDGKFTRAGGVPYTPVNELASQIAGEIIYYDDKPFSARERPYFRTDLRVYYKINYAKSYIEFSLDLQNLTNYQNIMFKEFIPETGKYNTFYQQGFFPLGTFKLLF